MDMAKTKNERFIYLCYYQLINMDIAKTVRKVVLITLIGIAAIADSGCATTPIITQSEGTINPKYLVQKGTPEYEKAAQLLRKMGIPEQEGYEVLNDAGSSCVGQKPLPPDYYQK